MLAGCRSDAGVAGPGLDGLDPTPECRGDEPPTAEQIEGPYFTPNSPQRVSLVEPGMIGRSLVLEGVVVWRSCLPVAQALVDVWQCDDAGVYDSIGFLLRGHQFTDAQGLYRFETIIPGLYAGRTPHIHVKVQAPGKAVLTTQLYFPDEPTNVTDFYFQPQLVIRMTDSPQGKVGSFRFVLEA